MKEWKEIWKIATDGKIQQKEEEWKEIIEMLDETSKVIEIGSYDGGSTFSLAEVAKEVLSVEPNSRWDVGNYENIKRFKAESANAVDSVKEYLGRKKVDMLIIDGDHSKKGVLEDYKNFKGFVKKGGAICFHDIAATEHHHRQGCFVDEAWEEIKNEVGEENVLEIKHEPSHWGQWGVIIKP